MRASLFSLPFIAVLVAAISAAVGSSFAEVSWMKYAGLGVAVAILLLWVTLDYEGFRKIFARKGAKFGASSGLSILMGIAVIVGVGYLSNKPRFNKSYDITKSQSNTLSEQTVKILNGMKEKNQQITVLAFLQGDEVKQSFKQLTDLYQKTAEVMAIEYIDPQVENTRATAENITTSNTVVLKLGGRETRLTSFNEEKLTNALVNVLKEKEKHIYFLKGHGEGELGASEANGFSMIKAELESNKYKVDTLSLLENPKVPDDCDALIIPGPKYNLKDQEIAILDAYLKKGGSMVVLSDAMAEVAGLNTLLSDYGLTFNSDMLIMNPNDMRAQIYGQNFAVISNFDGLHAITKDFASKSNLELMLMNARTVTGNSENKHKFNVESIGKSSATIVKIKNVKNKNDLNNLDESRVEVGEHPIVAVSVGKFSGSKLAESEGAKDDDKSDAAKDSPETAATKETRIVVVGSTQLATNLGLGKTEHKDFFLNIVSFLTRDEDFISIRPKDMEKGTVSLESPSAQLTLLFLSFIYPFLFLGGGLVHWFKRRRL